MTTRQGRATTTHRLVGTATYHGTSMGECYHGLHHWVNKVRGTWLNHYGGGQVLQIHYVHSNPYRLHHRGDVEAISKAYCQVLGVA